MLMIFLNMPQLIDFDNIKCVFIEDFDWRLVEIISELFF